MLVVYVAGPFRADNSWLIEQNIRRAEELSLKVWQNDMAAVCPHTNTRFFQGAADDDVWLKGDLEILERCDAVLLAPGWKDSRGTIAEVSRANDLKLPVFVSIERLLEWKEESDDGNKMIIVPNVDPDLINNVFDRLEAER
jgi:hypothetical protein